MVNDAIDTEKNWSLQTNLEPGAYLVGFNITMFYHVLPHPRAQIYLVVGPVRQKMFMPWQQRLIFFHSKSMETQVKNQSLAC